MRHFNRLLLLTGALALLGAGEAAATPVTYAFTSGTVTLSATTAGSAVMTPASFALSGTQVTVDEAAGTLNSLQFTLSDASITLTTPYAGYTAVHLDTASVTANGGTLTLIPPVDNPQEYAYSIAPVVVSGQLDATGSGPAITNKPFSITNPSASGSIFIESLATGGVLTLDGITIGALQVAGSAPLLIKADFTFQGASTVVPEPDAVLLFSSGLSVVALTLRRRIG